MSEDFFGYPTRTLANEYVRLDYLTTAGPRIVRLSLAGSDDNLLAEVADITIQTPYGEFCLFGGHRLWHAPEVFPRSYLPDNDAPEITDLPNGVRLTQIMEPASGIRKSIELRLEPDRPAVTVTHRLENQGAWPVELAPWALTQMRLGGLAVFPQTQGKLDETGLLPNRNLVLWPYSQLADPRLSLNDDFVFIKADALTPPVKVGYFNRHGWVGYLVGGVFCVKHFEAQPALPHPDFGCNVESYCNDRFIEVETVGPLHRLELGQTATHVERWELHPAPAVPQTGAGVRELIKTLSL
jgi:hypothetical protein